MAEVITDGTGTGYDAKVDNTNRLHTHAVTENKVEYASSRGDSYNINSGTMELTTANESSVLYFKNNGNYESHIASIGFLLGNSTGGSGDFNIAIVKNCSLGTLVSDAIDVAINQNKNVGSSQQLTIDAYKGGEGKTLEDGTDLYYSLVAGSGRPYVISTGTVVIPKGGSIGVKVTPQTGNTSMNLQVFLSVTEYKIDS